MQKRAACTAAAMLFLTACNGMGGSNSAMAMPGMSPSFQGSGSSGAQTPVEDGQPVGATTNCEVGSDATIGIE